MKRRLLVILMASLFFLSLGFNAYAKEYKHWEDVSKAMEKVLRQAYDHYVNRSGDDYSVAYKEVNTAYFKFYEKLGFEKVTMGSISGARGTQVENQFYLVKKSMKNLEDNSVVKEEIDTLVKYLHEDAYKLDHMRGKKSSGWDVFGVSLGLTLREGLEAILVIAAIIAYLVKTNNQKYLKGVYAGAILGVVVSIVLAFVFNLLADKIGDAASGKGQEIFEGIGMFLAVIVLFYVSNWMLSKSEVEVWNKYIQDKVDNSISTGNYLTLAFSAFIAVAREGAELIIFFQGYRTSIQENPTYLWMGILTAVLILAVIYFLITKYGVKLPLKPFFNITSALMFVLCFSFLGKGVYELQEADVIGRTIVPWMNRFSIDLLGIYDRLESLIPQLILVVITIITVIIQVNKNKKIRRELEMSHGK